MVVGSGKKLRLRGLNVNSEEALSYGARSTNAIRSRERSSISMGCAKPASTSPPYGMDLNTMACPVGSTNGLEARLRKNSSTAERAPGHDENP
jgi:hypothetical protein